MQCLWTNNNISNEERYDGARLFSNKRFASYRLAHLNACSILVKFKWGMLSKEKFVLNETILIAK